MIDSQLCFMNIDNYKEIDDIIDVGKKLGQYNVFTQPANVINYRFAYSSPVSDRYVRYDDTMIINDGDGANSNVKQTDSEITVVRVRCNGLPKRRKSKWDMQDAAIPGDGSHLGESPSMVNLATLVAHTNQNLKAEGKEYLVPLSSWDPYYKAETDELPNECSECWSENEKCNNTLKPLEDEDIFLDSSEDTTPATSPTATSSFASRFLDTADSTEFDVKGTLTRRPSLAGRISNFIRKRYKKTKTLPSPDSLDDKQSN